MTKSELIERIAYKQDQLPMRDVDSAVKMIIEMMSDHLADGNRIEIRGFGSFSLHYRSPRMGRNPKPGVKLELLVNVYFCGGFFLSSATLLGISR